ncbi:hypothetical protein SAMN05421823_101376 [Catalinimonas alkaloidigena]|uniref:DUF6250 domain-containing protein n=1 Tax=Catalinimonas alkaloidigena TaxID=1075417 RepID=A0A1G8XKI9_9BACT|nr:DUF6250 domain-containing protein [Catalinimonas alkaloidigena]SDJ90280.1 hypothetical protein SAMN05421823_101376 [Catalinimonas alkaloidigena]
MHHLTVRHMRAYLTLLVCLVFSGSLFAQSAAPPVALSWLHETAPTQPVGVSWGVPWARGTVKKNQTFTLSNAQGETLPLQTWPLAYWPDGSLKWSGFATVATGDGFQLALGAAPAQPSPLQVEESAEALRINTGTLRCVLPKQGSVFLDSLVVEGRVVGTRGQLTCVLQQGPDGEVWETPARERYRSRVTKVTLEQRGPVRAVVRVEGVMKAEHGAREWLPFSLRLYFYQQSASVRLVHTLTFDGDQERDFIKGLGVTFTVPMREQLHNRHVRFAGEGPGIWAEPVRPLVGRIPFGRDRQLVFPDQEAGRRVADQEAFDERLQPLIRDLPFWNDYKLVQNTADGFFVQKRTNPQSTWLDAAAGTRATGLAFVGDVSGGLAVGVKDFWQSHPAALEIRDAARPEATLHAWLWSPYAADAMDMRHYDTTAHGLLATYEDVQPGLSTPYGIARTSELTLFASAAVPSHDVLSQQARQSSQPPLLVTTPAYVHAIDVFGVWSLPDRSTPGKRWLEAQLDQAIAFYQTQIEQHRWYGFWNYGDVMHAYDSVRHTWRYDIGGFAWDNTELASDMWLWYSYLRSGRADIFRMAEAMTRHTSEVDVYHLGELAGLGSRHNVRHWGDGSKEVRESQAASRRFYYYLTTDERTGDMMREVAEQADLAMTRLDPLRLILPKSDYPTHARIGPDWLALVGNWMTEWERTGDKRWRDKIMAGVTSFAKMPAGFYSGKDGAFGYDPATQQLYRLGEDLGYSHLSALMGGPEVAFELTHLLQNKKWDRLWLQFCRLWGAPEANIAEALGKPAALGRPELWYARFPAYVAAVENDPASAARAWDWFLGDKTQGPFEAHRVDGADVLKPVREVPTISTNNTAQWCLNAIELLELVGDQLPEQHPLWRDADRTKDLDGYERGSLLFQDRFDQGMRHWKAEAPNTAASAVTVEGGKLLIDVDGGATVWLDQKLSGDLWIEYKRKVVVDGGKNDRLSDLNQFWMASDPQNPDLFTRRGVFSEYDSLQLYYAGVGGNTNTTTRFRKYPGNGERVLHEDLTDPAHLLQPNREYTITILVKEGLTTFWVDGERYFAFQDSAPLREGYFGFRTVQSRQEIDDFRVYRLP